MQLSKRELKLIRTMEHNRREKLYGIITLAVLFAVYCLLRYMNILESLEIPLDYVVYIAFLGQVFELVNRRNPDQAYVALLSRYVNSDADAIAALSAEKQRN